jgi:antirestriction protein ArdC
VKLPETTQHAEPDFQPAEQLIQATKADIRFVGNMPFYNATDDYICLPPKASFIGNNFYTTALHELAHWSEARVGWSRSKDNYAMGELVAEIASCFVATELGIPNTAPIENHAAYLKHWLQAMTDDANYIFTASRQASKVCDFLLSFVKPNETVPMPEMVEAA